MAIDIIRRTPRQGPTRGEKVSHALISGLREISESKRFKEELEAKSHLATQLEELKTQRAMDVENQKYSNKINLQAFKNAERRNIIDEIRGVKPQEQKNQFSYDDYFNATKQASEQLGYGLTDDQIQEHVQSQYGMNPQEMMEQDPFAESELYAAAGEHDLSQVAGKRAEAGLKEVRERRKETLPLRKEYADKGKYARESIENKKHALDLIKKGNVNDPIYVQLASKLPGAIGNALLSKETHLYKAGLFDEFAVLKNMFPGAIRVKEIELLEDKLATLDKSHPAKEAILENGMKKLERDVILSESARRVEKKNPNLSYLEFDEAVQQEAKPKLEKLYHEITDKYDEIYAKYAPNQTTWIDQNGNTYDNVPKNRLMELFKAAKKEGLELKVAP